MNATQATQTVATEVNVRWMIARDLPEVLAMDAGDGDPWTEGVLREYLGRSISKGDRAPCVGMVAETVGGEKVVGFMVYEMCKRRLNLLRLAVQPGYKRTGIGSAMLRKLQGKLTSHRRNRITIDVSEDNLAAQLFLRANGFRCVRVEAGAGDGGCDGLRFVYRVVSESEG